MTTLQSWLPEMCRYRNRQSKFGHTWSGIIFNLSAPKNSFRLIVLPPEAPYSFIVDNSSGWFKTLSLPGQRLSGMQVWSWDAAQCFLFDTCNWGRYGLLSSRRLRVISSLWCLCKRMFFSNSCFTLLLPPVRLPSSTSPSPEDRSVFGAQLGCGAPHEI